ncbi:MAG: PEP-CTERM sorting domain-containing protein [Gammaproteobacteria bacterium]|nr:PEP-CTERM sorting domain-containing protein [Gammaproteobacteria bacterium]
MMLKKLILRGITLSFLLTVSQSAFATVILGFTPNTQTVLLSGQASVNIVATNLQNEYVGAFDFDVSWDNSILSLASVSFGNALGGGSLSLQSENTDNGLGTSNLAESSLLSSLTSLQTGTTDIILATLIFDTLSVGQSILNLTGNIPGGGFLGNENGSLLTTSANTGLINVVTVSEPESLFLVGAGLLALFGMRRRNKTKVTLS